MSLDVDVAVDRVRVPVARTRLARVARATLRAEGVRHALLSVTFLGRRRITSLNREYLGHAGATDVIAFGFARKRPSDPVIGDVYIAPEVARANARARGIPLREEVVRLVVHGVLHVLGYEHPDGPGRERSPMWTRQESLVRRFGRAR